MSDRQVVERLLPGYEVGAELGRGGFGIVLGGRHRQLGRRVAIKQLPPELAADAGVRARFVTEARLLASLDHPHVVPVYDYVEQDGTCLLVMEALSGGTVWGRFSAQGYSPPQACAIVMVACSGLHHAHGHGILHRDVKPENLLLTESGQLKVADFGIAKMIGDDDALATSSGEILGTPAYMAPEQARGRDLGPQADVYAAGVMLYELLSGTLPFAEEGGALAIVYRHLHEQPRPLPSQPGVPQALADVVMRALSTEASSRFPTAEAFGVAIGAAATAAWGEDWLRSSGVPVLAGGAILASTQPLTGAGTGPRPSRPTAVVRAGTGHLSGSAVDARRDDVVPVRTVLAAPRPPYAAALVSAVLVSVLAVLALHPPSTPTPRPGSLRVNGQDASSLVEVDLADAFTLSAPASADEVRVRVSAAGLSLGSAATARAGSPIRLASSRFLAAGTVEAEATFLRGDRTVGVVTFPLKAHRQPFATVPGVGAVLALLFLLAYAESQLAPMRRRGRRRVASFVGLAVAGAGLGALSAVFVWLTGSDLLTGTALLRCALVGAAAGVSLGVLTAQAGRRARLRRIARKRDLGAAPA